MNEHLREREREREIEREREGEYSFDHKSFRYPPSPIFTRTHAPNTMIWCAYEVECIYEVPHSYLELCALNRKYQREVAPYVIKYGNNSVL